MEASKIDELVEWIKDYDYKDDKCEFIKAIYEKMIEMDMFKLPDNRNIIAYQGGNGRISINFPPLWHIMFDLLLTIISHWREKLYRNITKTQ